MSAARGLGRLGMWPLMGQQPRLRKVALTPVLKGVSEACAGLSQGWEFMDCRCQVL